MPSQPDERTATRVEKSIANVGEPTVAVSRCPNGHSVPMGESNCPTCGTFVSALDPPVAAPRPTIPGYELLQELGRGGMGVVYKARQTRLNRIVALKMIIAGEIASLETRQRFQREAEAVARLQHPNIVQLFEMGDANGQAFFSLEFVDGTTLAGRLQGVPLLPQVAARIMVALATAVQFAHDNGIIHRDLKPANVLLAGDRSAAIETCTVKITDFGLAKHAHDSAQHTQTGMVMGTPSYMAPEQARGSQSEIGPATDTYALGAILYELLTGRPPFLAPSSYGTMAQVLNSDPVPIRQLQDKVPRDLEVICLKCLRKEPAKRYGSARELAEDLQRFLAGEPIHARPAGVVERTVKWVRRRPAIAALWAGAIAIVIASFLVRSAYARRVQETRSRTHAENLVGTLRKVDTPDVPRILNDLVDYRAWADPLLWQALQDAPPNSKESLHVSLALASADPSLADGLVDPILVADFPAIAPMRSILKPHDERIAPKLWSVLMDPELSGDKRLRAACVLADYAPTDARWRECAASLVEPLLAAVGQNPGNYTPLSKDLAPVRAALLLPLREVFQSQGTAEFQPFMAAHFLADYAADQPLLLADLLMDANAKQFPILFKEIKDRPDALAALSHELDRRVPDGAVDDVREKLAKRQANAGAALMALKQPDKVWPLLKHSPDPRLRSYLIHRIGPLGGDLGTVVRRLDEETDVTAQRALTLSLGRFGDMVTPQLRRKLLPKFEETYRTASDPGLHGATEWLLRQWDQQAWLSQVNQQWADDARKRDERIENIKQSLTKKDAAPQWYVNGQGQTMVVVPGPVKFLMGSPVAEVGRFTIESNRPMHIDRSFAVAAAPVTVAQFERFKPDHKFTKRYAPQPDCPVITISWYNAALYCNWLSQQEGIPPDQWCYEPDDGKVVKMKEGYLRRTGYRLPTDAEFEYATRSGTTTSRYFGETEELIGHYGWYVNNSEDHTWPVGLKMPNDFGLFDTYGNVWNWCQQVLVKVDRPVEDKEEPLPINPQENRIVRGGCYVVRPWNLRSANFDWHLPAHQTIFDGFRVARTIAP